MCTNSLSRWPTISVYMNRYINIFNNYHLSPFNSQVTTEEGLKLNWLYNKLVLTIYKSKYYIVYNYLLNII